VAYKIQLLLLELCLTRSTVDYFVVIGQLGVVCTNVALSLPATTQLVCIGV